MKRKGNGAGAVAFFHHRNHLKTFRLITDSAGTEVRRTTFRPFGDKAAETGTHVEAKGYIGERHNAETGFLYLHARFYDPILGRFISSDWWDPNKPGVGTNRYAYADNGRILEPKCCGLHETGSTSVPSSSCIGVSHLLGGNDP
ncbi:MAG TPA: RHS repeat-associated core domain-containing protein [Hyphomicrobiaceae bacterium]|nr:RHS repeat-associated core domain-containing protein [Hyphomicrobiaceae bacterium]